jgi:putative mycofactocin binding protein MftB
MSGDRGPLDGPRLSDGVSLRRESFGGIAYSFGTRRLQIVHSTYAVDVALAIERGDSPERIALRAVAEGKQSDLAASRRHVARMIERLTLEGLLE